MKRNLIIAATLVIALGGAVTVFATRQGRNTESVAVNSSQVNDAITIVKTPTEQPIKNNTNYISYADYNSNKDNYKNAKVVLYFHAPWCPTCQALDKDITANINDLPTDTVIVKTDYDSSTELKKKYGVTYQHTLVQVDNNGEKINKWSGSPQLKDVVSKIQT